MPVSVERMDDIAQYCSDQVQSSSAPRSLLSTLVDCADDLFTLETEVNPFDVEW